MSGSKTLFILSLVFLVFFSGYVHAEINVLSYPSTVYFTNQNTKNIDISFSCSFDNESVASAYVQFDNLQKQLAVYNGYAYTTSLTLLNLPTLYGNKTLKFYCYGSDGGKLEKTEYIQVYGLSLSIVNPSLQQTMSVYQGDFFYNVEANFEVKGANVQQNVSSIFVYLKNVKGEYPIYQIAWVQNGGKIDIAGLIPYTIPPGEYNLIVKAKYLTSDGEIDVEGEEDNVFEVKSPLSIASLTPQRNTEIEVHQTKLLDFKFKLLDKGKVVSDLSQNNVVLMIGDKEVSLNSFDYDSSTSEYEVKATVVAPENFTSTPDILTMRIKGYKNYPVISFPLYSILYVVDFKGSLMLPDRTITTAQFILSGKMNKVLSTSNIGNYDISLLKGKYNLSMYVDNDVFYIHDLDVEGDITDPIKLDYPDVNIKWVNVVKSVVLEVALPYSYVDYKITYNDKDVLDERKLTLYKCSYWNFGKRMCVGKWEEVKDVSINIGANTVSFKGSAGAYVLVEKDHLSISGTLNKNYFYVGEPVVYSGVVYDLKGNGVADVDVNYFVPNTNIQGDVKTDAAGKFNISFSAPNGPAKISTFTLNLKPVGEAIDGEPTQVQFQTEKRVRLVAYVDDVVQVDVGKPKDVNITLKNEGDLDLTNIEIHLAGLKSEWYTLTPIFIESLKPGQQTNVLLRIDIPSNYCVSPPQECKEYYFVSMRFKAKETTEDISFTLRINQPNNQTNNITASTVSENKGSSPFTGFFTYNPSSNVNYYIIAAFFLLAFILITVKKKSRRSRVEARFRRIPGI